MGCGVKVGISMTGFGWALGLKEGVGVDVTWLLASTSDISISTSALAKGLARRPEIIRAKISTIRVRLRIGASYPHPGKALITALGRFQ